MPVRKWLFQYIVMVPAAAVFLGLVQFMKGRSPEYAVAFGALWGAVSVTLFFAVRIHHFRKNRYCRICRDLPPPDETKEKDARPGERQPRKEDAAGAEKGLTDAGKPYQ